MIKVVVVNETNKKADLYLNKQFQYVVKYFLTKKIRNKLLLENKSEISFVFLSANEMKKINFQFRKKNKPTDVLSFQSDDESSIGELLFCLDVLKIQAKEQGHSVEQELLYMMIHGLLHLLGYDHELSKNEEKLMFRLQDQCFTHLNVKSIK